MIISVLFIILFLLCLSGAVLLPKTEAKINGTKALVMGTMAVFCYQALLAFIYDKIGIDVGIESTCVSMAAAVLVLWGIILKKRKVQRLFFRITDIAALVLLAAVVLAISLHMFTPNLRLSYVNTDPANHFNMAMSIVKNGVIEDSIYFSAFVDAMFIELFAPLLSLAKYYKAFIAADIFMHVLEIWMFYVLVLTVSDKKVLRVFAPVFALGYFFGYPAYSYMTGGFVYWGIGGMILILMVYALILLERHPRLWRYTVPLLLLAAYANSCCNTLFVPVNYAALFLALIALGLTKWRKKLNWKIVLGFAAVLLLAVLAFAFLAWDKWGGSFERVIEHVSKSGAMYRSMYSDLVFFLPAAFVVFYFALVKREYSKTVSLMAICMVVCACVMYAFIYNHMMSFYYYYKIYYNLWMFGWILAAMALDILADKRQMAGAYSYMGMIGVIAVLTFTNYDMNMWKFDANYNGDYAPKHLFSLYWYNLDTLQKDYEEYTMPVELMDVFAYATEELDDALIPPLVENDNYFYWFDGMRAQNTRGYKPFGRELMDILVKMDRNDITKILVDKEDGFYQEYESYFSLCKVVYENERAAILTCPGESWTKILDSVEGYSKEKLKLYNYVKKNLEDERVPMMASKDACVDYVIYRRRTGQKSTDCYTWNFNPRENLDNLNELGIRYVLLFYDDAFYLQNQVYFDSQETVFETEAGKIVRCIGDSWSTEYQAVPAEDAAEEGENTP